MIDSDHIKGIYKVSGKEPMELYWFGDLRQGSQRMRVTLLKAFDIDLNNVLWTTDICPYYTKKFKDANGGFYITIVLKATVFQVMDMDRQKELWNNQHTK